MLTPNKYPINADITIAIVPQIQILHTDLLIEDPPTFAARVPDKARKRMENPYWKNIICFKGAKTANNRGNIPPTIKEAADAMEACKGFAREISLIPNSSRACASKALLAVSCFATSMAISLVSPLFSYILASSVNSISGVFTSSFFSLFKSAVSTSSCELTETYSPAAIDNAPATTPANVASMIGSRDTLAAATPMARLVVERMPSLAPNTEALSHPLLFTK